MISHTSLQQLALYFSLAYGQMYNGMTIVQPGTGSQHQADTSMSTSVPQALLSWLKGTFEHQGLFLDGQNIFYLHLNSKIMIPFLCAFHICNFWVFHLQLEDIAHTEFILNGFLFSPP